jgi:hypothetical protein
MNSVVAMARGNDSNGANNDPIPPQNVPLTILPTFLYATNSIYIQYDIGSICI